MVGKGDKAKRRCVDGQFGCVPCVGAAKQAWTVISHCFRLPQKPAAVRRVTHFVHVAVSACDLGWLQRAEADRTQCESQAVIRAAIKDCSQWSRDAADCQPRTGEPVP